MKVGEKGENLGRPSLRKNLMKSQTHFKNIVPKKKGLWAEVETRTV